MNPQSILDSQTPPIEPDLLSFGIGVFQAALSGELQLAEEVESDGALAHRGLHALQHEIEGHGLSEEQEMSLMFRVLAFPPLLERAASDHRTHEHVVASGEGYVISEQFLRAASRCQMRAEGTGAFGFDMDSLVKQLLN